jgi:putative peptide zinc metalloprotease protein
VAPGTLGRSREPIGDGRVAWSHALDVLEIVLPDQTRFALVGDVTIGRADENAVRLPDPSVSRVHARISSAGDRAVLEDAGSTYGTWLDGRRVSAPTPLRAGARIRVGNEELLVDRPRSDDEAGPTIVAPDLNTAALVGRSPRLRGGHALKRLEAAEGTQRWVLEDRRAERFVRIGDEDAELVRLLDGRRTLEQLMAEATRRLGPVGPARLTLLLASLGERGFLGGESREAEDVPPRRLQRLVASRQLPWRGADRFFERLYRHGGALLVGRAARGPLAALAATGAIVFAYLVAGRYGTPFVVASKVGVGGVVFVVGRLAVAAIHEMAHGLVMASFGRPVREAGLKVVLIFPYVYVDTSAAWFEPRRRRIAVSAAGPASDLCLGATFSLCSLAAGAGAIRDVLFQVAFGAYVGAFFNLNPLVERDGYHILVDVLREPGLRQRAREELRRRIAGGGEAASPVIARYALFGLAWSAFGALLGIAMSLRYEPAVAAFAPAPVVWPAMSAVWLALLVPVIAAVGPPALERLRARRA